MGYDGAVNRVETLLFLLFATFSVALFGVYHFMIFAVNKRVPRASRIPHVRLSRGGLWASHGFEWKMVTREYKRLYPSSFVNYFTVACLASITATAIAFVALRVWEYTNGRLP